MALESVPSLPGSVSLPTAGKTQPALQHGQILSARVDHLLPDGTARIASSGGSFDVRLSADLRPGTQLQLQVVRTGAEIKLVILDPAAPQTTGGGRGAPQIAGALQAASSAQGSLAPVIANAGAVAARPEGSLPTAVQSALEQLAAFRLSTNGALNVDRLRDAILNSGLFYDARLAAGAAPAVLTGDMKAVLFALQAALRGWLGGDPQLKTGTHKTAPPVRGGALNAGGGTASPSDLRSLSSPEIAQMLLAQTGAALARLRLAQFASLPDDTEISRTGPLKGAAEWTFELPFALGDRTTMIQFKLSRDAPSGADESEITWRIGFSLDIEPLGPVHAAVTWQRHQVAVTLWAETEGGLRRLQRETAALSTALEGAALDIDAIQVLSGRPAQPTPDAGLFVDRAT